MTSLFFSYSHRDEELRDHLETHLAMLKRQGIIDVWHDRRIIAGDNLDHAIDEHLESADVILLLVSSDFLASDYCYDVEVARAMERHKAGEARVIPVILRPCDWRSAPFGNLLATPPDGKPITKWPDLDEAFLHVVSAIRDAAKASHSTRPSSPSRPTSTVTGTRIEGPRSSNLRLRKSFTEADRDRFLDDAFEYMARFFENSLEELSARNADIETSFKRIDARQFTVVVYSGGEARSRCRIRLGGLAAGITYSNTDSSSDNSYNECLSVSDDEQGLFLKPFGMAFHQSGNDPAHLTFEGAAEYCWAIFIEPLQR